MPLRFLVQTAQAEAARLQHHDQQQQQQQQPQEPLGAAPSGAEGSVQGTGEAEDSSNESEGGESDSEGLSEFGLGGSDGEEGEEGGQMEKDRHHTGSTRNHTAGQPGDQEEVGHRSAAVIRGLGLRLRMCAHFGLMPCSGVFKVYNPASSSRWVR